MSNQTQLTDGSTIADNVILKNTDGSSVSSTNRLTVDTLGQAGVARQLAAGSSSANTALTTSCKRISMRAVTADIRYSIGSTSQTASSTSHFIAQDERIDLDLPTTPNIGIIRNASTSGTLEVTELV